MSCAGLTGGQLRAAGGFFGGSGIGSVISAVIAGASGAPILAAAQSALGGMAGALLGGSGGDIFDAVTTLSPSGASSLISAGLGSSLAAGLSGSVLGPAQLALGGNTNFLGKLASHATTFLPVDISSATQLYDQMDGFSKLSLDIIPTASRLLNTEFGAITSYVKDFDFTAGGFLGVDIPDFNNLITNGVAGLVDGLPASVSNLGADLLKVGEFGDFTDLQNLMNPGQLVNQMLNKGLGEVGGLANNLLSEGIQLADLNNPLYQDKIQAVMNGVTGITDLADIQKVMGSSLNIQALGEITDINKIINPNLIKNFSTLQELGEKLEIRGASSRFGTVKTLGEFGDLVSNLATSSDLTLLQDESTLVDQASFDLINNVYGNGSGPSGSVLTRDMIGSAAGYGYDIWMATYEQAATDLNTAGTTATAQAMYGEASAGINGDYTTGLPGFEIITDPRTSIAYDNLDDFVIAKSAQISGEFATLDGMTDPNLDAIATNWENSNNAVANEINTLAQTDIDPSLVTPGHKGSMWSFASRLGDRGIDEYDTADFLERIATNDLAGESVKFALREGRNSVLHAANEMQYPGNVRDDPEPTEQFVVTLPGTDGFPDGLFTNEFTVEFD